MKYIELKTVNKSISKIAIGCMNWGGDWDKNSPIDSETIKRAEILLETSIEEGYNFFDLADIYCRGKSEIVFREVIKKRKNLRDKIIIQTKCGIIPAGEPNSDSPHRYDLSKKHIISSVENSLKRLNLDYIDILLAHRPDPLANVEEINEAIEKLFSEGKIKAFGASNFNSSQLKKYQTYLNQKIIANQIQLSLFHSSLIDAGVDFNNNFKSKAYYWADTLDFCFYSDILIQAYSLLGKGVLNKDSSGKYLQLKNLIEKLSQEKNVSIESLLISWLLKLPYKLQPIIGTVNPKRIKEISKANSDLLTREDWYKLYLVARGEDIP